MSPCRARAAKTPVRSRALEAWLRRARIRRGPVFRRITAAGTIEGRLTGDGVYKILQVRAAAAKLTVVGDRAAVAARAARRNDHRGDAERRAGRADHAALAAQGRRARCAAIVGGRGSWSTTRRGCSTCEAGRPQERAGLCRDPPRAEGPGSRTRRWRPSTPTGCAIG